MQTWDSNRIEKESKRNSALITVGLNLLLFLAFYFIVVWRQPSSPLPSYGLELNLGFTDTGSGTRNSPNPPSDNPAQNTDQAAPGEVAPVVIESSNPVAAPKTETARPNTSSKPAVNQAVTKTPSPIKGEEKAAVESKKKPDPVKTEPAKTVTSPSKSDAQKTTQKATEQPRIDQRAIFGAGGTSGKSTSPSSGGAQGSSNTKGDEGRPTGTIDGRALMGEGSGKGANSGSGYSLDLAGWEFGSRPNINDRVSVRNGKIVFKITVDDSGRVVQAIPLEYNVTNDVLSYYRQVVNQINFRRSGGTAAADFSTGKITFLIQVD